MKSQTLRNRKSTKDGKARKDRKDRKARKTRKTREVEFAGAPEIRNFDVDSAISVSVASGEDKVGSFEIVIGIALVLLLAYLIWLSLQDPSKPSASPSPSKPSLSASPTTSPSA